MSTNQFRRYIDLLNEADAIPNPYANDPKQAAIYASLSPEDQEWATRGGGRPDLTDPYIANRAPNKFTPVAQAAPPLMRGGTAPAQSNSETFGNAEPDLVPPNTDVALPSANTFSNDDAVAAALSQQNSDTRCAVCGTPQNQHQNLKHKFISGDNTPPAPVPQVGATAGSGDIGRIKQLQRELKQAGANLGQTGAGRDGIDGDLGPLTQAAMSKYPDIAAKYADLSGSAAAPVAQAATPAVDTSKLSAALSAIEAVIAKYKGKTKVSERQIYEVKRKTNRTPPSFTQDELDRMTARPSAAVPAAAPATANPNESPEQKRIRLQKAAQANLDSSRASSTKPAQPLSIYDRFNKPSGAPVGPAKAVELKPSGWAARAGKAILSKLPGLGARTAARAGATALSGPLAPLVGVAGTLYTIWDVGNMLYDAYKDSNNLEGMNDADQAVIKQNLAVVNSFMKDPKIADTLPQDIKTRVEKVFLDLDQLAKETGYAVPGQQPVSTAPQQAATPAATPAATTVAPKLNVTLDQLDKLLKKNNFESKGNSLSESEQLARYRDIVNEGPVSWAAKNVIAPTARYAWNSTIKPAAKLTTQIATAGALGYGGWQGIAWWKDLKAPKTMNIADQAEFNRLLADLEKMLPDRATADALPPDVQEKLISISNRVQIMKQQGNK